MFCQTQFQAILVYVDETLHQMVEDLNCGKLSPVIQYDDQGYEAEKEKRGSNGAQHSPHHQMSSEGCTEQKYFSPWSSRWFVCTKFVWKMLWPLFPSKAPPRKQTVHFSKQQNKQNNNFKRLHGEYQMPSSSESPSNLFCVIKNTIDHTKNTSKITRLPFGIFSSTCCSSWPLCCSSRMLNHPETKFVPIFASIWTNISQYNRAFRWTQKGSCPEELTFFLVGCRIFWYHICFC